VDPRPDGLWSRELIWLTERHDVDAIARLDHRHGHVVRARVARTDSAAFEVLVRLIAALLRSPAATLLHSLTLGRLVTWSMVDTMLDTLFGQRQPILLEHLRELMLGDFVYPDETELSWVRVGDLARVLQACPSLRSLHARGASIACETAIDHPQLTRLTLETGGLACETVQALVSASLPNLRQLELWFGQPKYGATATIDDLAPLLHADALPSVRELGLVDCEFADALAEALARSPRLARLERVDLSRGTLRESGGQAILDHAERFRHLRSLDLDGNYLPPELADALGIALPGVVRIGEQIDPAIGRPDGPPGYYAAVGE
jgi:hypothetical protein